MHLSALFGYPLKSAAGVSLNSAEVEPRGLHGDRRWLLVDPDGKFVSGREMPALVRLQADDRSPGQLRLALDGHTFTLALPGGRFGRIAVQVWASEIDAAVADPAASRWLSTQFGRPLRLVHMDDLATRWVESKYCPEPQPVSFADGFPLLLLGESALAELNRRSSSQQQMLQFRPNLVFSGGPPHCEDQWKRLRIGAVEFEVVKPCVRCVFTTIDPRTGERLPGGEPLATLKHYRRSAKGITFGMNLIARGVGTLTLGAPIEVLETAC